MVKPLCDAGVIPAAGPRTCAEGAEIHWGAESGLRSADVRGRGLAPKGQTPMVRVNSRRHGLPMISTVTPWRCSTYPVTARR
jgi:hypothetical protein